MGLAVACLAPACLCSCGDDAASTPAADTPATAATTPATPQPTSFPARDALFDELLNNISPLVTDRAMAPEFNEEAKILLEKLQAYYTELTGTPVTAERVMVARRIADVTRNLGAYTKAREAYERTQADLEALPESDRQSLAGRRLQSAISGGIGLCLLSSEKATEALPYYEKALETDLALLRSLGPAEGESLPQGELSADLAQAISDVLGSYRCLGDCLIYSEDPEEGRSIYQKGIDLMTELNATQVPFSVALSFAKLQSSLGDLENYTGREREALTAWAQAAKICRDILRSGSQPAIQIQARRCFNQLAPLIKEKAEKLQREAQAAQDTEAAKAAEEAAAQAEPAPEAEPPAAAEPTPEPAAEAAAPAPTEEEAAPQREEDKPRKRNRRNRRNRH